MPARAKGLIFVISGPSGSGKTTLRNRVLKNSRIKPRFAQSVSFTTRPQRTGEVNGRDYFFIAKSEFSRLLKAKKVLEWTEYLGYYYGTPRDFVDKTLAKGKSIVLCLDLKGVSSVKRLYPHNSVSIFVLPPSFDALRRRIENRCARTHKKEISARLRLAKRELGQAAKCDYALVNEHLRDAVKQLRRIIFKEMDFRRGK